jgi:hypothetical protein
MEPEVIIKHLDGIDPLLHAPAKAIGPRQLSEEETRTTDRHAFQNNPGLTSSETGKAIGSSRRTVDSYIADLRKAIQMDLDLKIFRTARLGIPEERIAKRFGFWRQTLSDHSPKMAALPNPVNSDLRKGFTVSRVAEKHGWTELILVGPDKSKIIPGGN